jgi:hypothetical protein
MGSVTDAREMGHRMGTYEIVSVVGLAIHRRDGGVDAVLACVDVLLGEIISDLEVSAEQNGR